MAELKTLASVKVAGKSTFLELTKGLPANTSLAMFAGNTGAMVAGHESIVESVDYEEVQGLRTPAVRSQDGRGQIVSIGGVDYQLAKDGEKPQAVTVRFESGRTMTLGLILQGQDKTLFHFKGDAAPTKATDLNLGNIAEKLVGKKLKCTKYYRDATNPVLRSNPDPNDANKTIDRSYAANCYEFIETDI